VVLPVACTSRRLGSRYKSIYRFYQTSTVIFYCHVVHFQLVFSPLSSQSNLLVQVTAAGDMKMMMMMMQMPLSVWRTDIDAVV
jgi:hypothetical protein